MIVKLTKTLNVIILRSVYQIIRNLQPRTTFLLSLLTVMFSFSDFKILQYKSMKVCYTELGIQSRSQFQLELESNTLKSLLLLCVFNQGKQYALSWHTPYEQCNLQENVNVLR